MLNMSDITTLSFWKAVGARVLYTFMAAIVPYVLLVQSGEVSITDALSISGLTAFAALLTAVASLPEIDTKTMPVWQAIGHRVLRTGAQSIAAGIAGALLLQDVPWQAVLIGAAGAVVTTLLRTFMDVLPETAQDQTQHG